MNIWIQNTIMEFLLDADAFLSFMFHFIGIRDET